MKDVLQTIFCYAIIIALILTIISMNVWLVSILIEATPSFWECFGIAGVLFIDWMIGTCFRICNEKR